MNRNFTNHSKNIILGFVIAMIAFGSLAVSKSEYYRQLEKSQKLFHWINRELMSKYVDDIDVEAFTKKSIQNMLSELDPYTVYMENEERDGLDMLTYGKYSGIGIQIGRRDGSLTVIAPMDDTPAYRAGIISGDRIISIDDNPTDDMNLDDAASLIRGEKNTEVILIIERYGVEEQLEFKLVREDIQVDDVTYTGMLDETTGYIRLTRFSKNSVAEMKQAFKELEGAGAIILDLRDNPGGLLQSAIGVLDLMIDKDEILLTTKGKQKNANKSFKSSKHPIIDDDMKIAVLINGGSASASEIVSGAIQDLDRGVVLGTRSFGKGLVQTVYNFDENRSLKITTAKYYIPSGRLIQKPDYNNEEVISWSASEDSIFKTLGGRAVKGGGGIYPDLIVENNKPSTLVRECWRKGLFFSYAQENRDRFSTLDDIEIDETVLSDFQNFLELHELDLPVNGEAELNEAMEKLVAVDSTNSELNQAFEDIQGYIKLREATMFSNERDQIIPMLKGEFANLFDGSRGKIAVTLETDPVISKAREVLENVQSYNEVFAVK